MFQIGLRKLLLLKNLKIMLCEHVLSVILKAKKLLQHFMKKIPKITNELKFTEDKK